MALAFARQWLASGTAQSQSERLSGAQTGLVPIAQQAERGLLQTLRQKDADKNRVTYLQGIQAPGKVVIEFLNAVAQNVDPSTRRIRLENYKLFRDPSGIKIMITGIAQASGSRTLGDVLDGFRQDLRSSYPAISSIADLGSKIEDNSMTFQWELNIDYEGSIQASNEPHQNARTNRGSRGGS